MWFKTRVAFFEFPSPLDFRVAEYLEDKPPHCAVYLRSSNDRNFEYKGIFGTAKSPGPTLFLAMFLVSKTTPSEIAQCMKIIEEAVRDDATVCDLSAIGDQAAWPKAWAQIEWQP